MVIAFLWCVHVPPVPIAQQAWFPEVPMTVWPVAVTMSGQIRRACYTILLVAALVALAGCERNEPLRIGYLGTLTGRQSDLGIAGRDGVIFAVEEINRQGGINGRQVTLVTMDDRGDPAAAKVAVRELVGRKVAAIVGPMTSAIALATVPEVGGAPVVMVSPTVSSNELTGKDDNFVRVYPPSSSTARHLAIHARKNLGLDRVAVIYDVANQAHTEGWYRRFRDHFESLGGVVGPVETFDSTQPVSFLSLSRVIASARPDGVFILAGGLDTAMFCQQFQKLSSRFTILASEWSSTDELILHGGSAVNGILFYQNFDRNDRSARFSAFREAYRQRYSTDPDFGAVYAYDAAQVVFRGLAAGNPAGLRGAIVSAGRFAGVQGEFTIDRSGDAERTPFLMTVRNGEFRRVE
ncbi:MAG: amino acid ABC transporter substrate-binding protein [Desulfuromonadales bacterium]|nr:MAG: amino acid ABC transporter substrate-binding protein [Desulfuromonadales bacterium]